VSLKAWFDGSTSGRMVTGPLELVRSEKVAERRGGLVLNVCCKCR